MTLDKIFTADEIRELEDSPYYKDMDEFGNAFGEDGGVYNRPRNPGRVLRIIFAREVLGSTMLEAGKAEGIGSTSVFQCEHNWFHWATQQECYKRAAAEYQATHQLNLFPLEQDDEQMESNVNDSDFGPVAEHFEISATARARHYVYNHFKDGDRIDTKIVVEKTGLRQVCVASAFTEMRKRGVLEPIGKMGSFIVYKVANIKLLEEFKDGPSVIIHKVKGHGAGRHCNTVQDLPHLDQPEGESPKPKTAKILNDTESVSKDPCVVKDHAVVDELVGLAIRADREGLTREMCMANLEMIGVWLARLRA